MRIEIPEFIDTTLGRRVLSVVRAVGTAAETVRKVWAQGTAQAAPAPNARTALDAVLRIGREAVRSRGQYQLGKWQPIAGLHPQNAEIERQLRTRAARYGQTTIGMGTEPFSWGFTQTSEITPISIADAHRRAISSGWLDTKVDTHTRFLCDDTHVGGVDQIRRSGFYRYPLRIAPLDGDNRPSAILLANAVRAALAQCDGLTSSLAETTGAMCGFGAAELVYRPGVRIAIPVGARQSVLVESEIVSEVVPISQRYVAFDVVTERPYLVYGPGQYVDMLSPDMQKFLFIKGDGQASQPMRFRGWGWSIDWMSYLASLDINKLGIVVETFGVPTPYLQRNDSGIVTEDEAAEGLQLLSEIGTGRPAVVPTRLGELKHSPVPAGLAPIHAQFLSVIRAEQSKRILSSTLQTQLDSNGSWAAAQIHEGQEVKVSKIDTKLSAEAVQSQLCRNLVDANAEVWATALSSYIPGGVTPDELRSIPLVCEIVVADEAPAERLKVYQGARDLRVPTDPAQFREETGLRPPPAQLQSEENGNA